VLAPVLGLPLFVDDHPILICPNLQLDLVDDLALGKEWQLGYWKHPPLRSSIGRADWEVARNSEDIKVAVSAVCGLNRPGELHRKDVSVSWSRSDSSRKQLRFDQARLLPLYTMGAAD
jgi:hypothetical protein